MKKIKAVKIAAINALVLGGGWLALVTTAAGAFDSNQSIASRSTDREIAGDGRLSLPQPKAGRAKPLVVIVAQNEGAETTDFMIPLGIIRDSGVADVHSVSTGSGPVTLMPNFKIVADETIRAFDAAEPSGADIVIVPAQHNSSDPTLTSWIKVQAAKDAVIFSICEGARVVAGAGLLKGKRATTHWFATQELQKKYPDTDWVTNKRYVQDGNVISTSGVTASIPTSLALVEAISGPAAARRTANRLGVSEWTSVHRSADFILKPSDAANVLLSYLLFWSNETIEAPLTSGMNEVSLALRADAWTRSYSANVVSTSTTKDGVVRSLHGLVILPDGEPNGGLVLPGQDGPAVAALGNAISAIRARYGPSAACLAVLGLEYDAPSP